MIRSLVIDGYRGFQDFKLEGLGRINVLVGENGSGKTSLLEAVALLGAEDPIQTLRVVQSRRGLGSGEVHPQSGVYRHTSTWHLFPRWEDRGVGPLATITGTQDEHAAADVALSFEARRRTPDESPADLRNAAELATTVLAYSRTPGNHSGYTRLDREHAFVDVFVTADAKPKPSWAVLAPGHRPKHLWRGLDDAQASAAEDRLTRLIQVFDPRVREYAVKDRGIGRMLHLKLEGAEDALPVQLLGEGLVNWAVVLDCIAAHEVPAVLCVDEFLATAHHSLHAKLWGAMAECLNSGTQLLASTHSEDCLRGLAAAVESGAVPEADVRVIRLEGGPTGAPVVFDGEELLTIVQKELEVR